MQAKLFVNKTIGELMFEGYDDPVLQIYSSFDSEEEDELDSFFDDEEGTTPVPAKIPMDKFGWFYKVGRSAKTRGRQLGIALPEERDDLV